jgi:NAD+ synthase (glutamine-hydrolysing)
MDFHSAYRQGFVRAPRHTQYRFPFAAGSAIAVCSVQGVPKALIQHLIRWVISSQQFDDTVNHVLQSVLDTEISPELLPSREDEEIQSSEDNVGPCVLQDFSLFQVLRFGFPPSKVAFLAWHA